MGFLIQCLLGCFGLSLRSDDTVTAPLLGGFWFSSSSSPRPHDEQVFLNELWIRVKKSEAGLVGELRCRCQIVLENALARD